jgi:hypothetical protein
MDVNYSLGIIERFDLLTPCNKISSTEADFVQASFSAVSLYLPVRGVYVLFHAPLTYNDAIGLKSQNKQVPIRIPSARDKIRSADV